MKKLCLLSLIFFTSIIKNVSADFDDLNFLIQDFLGVGYYHDTSFALLKIGIWILLFTFLMKGTERIFPENRTSSFVVAFIISIMGVAFIPPEFINSIGAASGTIGIFIIIGGLLFLPWMIITALNLSEILGKWNFFIYGILLLVEAWLLKKILTGTGFSSDLDIFSSLYTSLDKWSGAIYVVGFILVFGGILSALRGRRANPGN